MFVDGQSGCIGPALEVFEQGTRCGVQGLERCSAVADALISESSHPQGLVVLGREL